MTGCPIGRPSSKPCPISRRGRSESDRLRKQRLARRRPAADACFSSAALRGCGKGDIKQRERVDAGRASNYRQVGSAPPPRRGLFSRDLPASRPRRRAGLSTAIYYLLPEGERSHWHRVDAVEIWHWYGGAPLALSLSGDGLNVESHQLGSDIAAGQRPQVIVPADAWQSAESLGPWTLVGCTVSPAFVFEGFEMAAADWMPG